MVRAPAMKSVAGSPRILPSRSKRPSAVSRGIYDVSGAHLYRLPGSRQEVIAAEQSLNHPDRSVALLGPDATESKFKSQPLGNFRILHFAVHGLSDPQFPDRAALVLGRAPNTSDDGLLEFQERVAQTCVFCRSAALPVFPPEKPQTSESTRSALPTW
jgi:CHAT domain-containing protein